MIKNNNTAKAFVFIATVFFLLTIPNLAFSANFVKGPYMIYPNSNTGMTLLWQLDKTQTCTLKWGTDLSCNMDSIESNEFNKNHQHKITLEDLKSDKKYYYKVIFTGDDTKEKITSGSFNTAPSETEEDLKFVVYGDTRSQPKVHNKVCRAILDKFSEDSTLQTFMLHTGDWIGNGNKESHWNNQYFSRNSEHAIEMHKHVPVMGCMGNHEGSGDLFKKYWPYNFVNKRYYSFDYGPLHVAVLDQYSDYSEGSEQLNWLREDLAGSKKEWKFILLHQPGWSAGHHGNDKAVQERIQPLCKKYGVQMVFAGHNHYYARIEKDGVLHLTCGGGGAPLYEAPKPEQVEISKSTNHFVTLEIQDQTTKFKVWDTDLDLIDSGVINNAD